MKKLAAIESFLLDESYLTISGDSYLTVEGRDSDTFTLADHTAVYDELMYRYGGRLILVPEDGNALTVFTKIYTNWVNRRKRDIATLLDTWQRDYNPIENYDARTQMTGDITDTETPGAGRMHKTTQTPTNWKSEETKQPTNWKETETEQKNTGADASGVQTSTVVPFGGATPVTVSETVNDVNTKRETEQSGSFKTTSEQLGTFETKDELLGPLENKKDYNTTEWRHGNIGVMAAPDLALKQYEQRKIDILDEVLKEFIDKYTIYV